MSNILSMLSQYELLERVAHYLTPRDLFHLASTNVQLYTLILKSEPIFARLKRVTLCDGHGLTMRQDFRGPLYELYTGPYLERIGPPYDEELEVRVWNLKCDAANALPCLKCEVNVCEECRYVPRVRDLRFYRSSRRPHHDPTLMCHDIICYCDECDKQVEHDLPLSLSAYCDCDQYTRWICLPCRTQEYNADLEYLNTRTKWDYSMSAIELQNGKWIDSHQDRLAFWCPCGKRAPSTGNVRCSWCKKKHDIRTWRAESANYIPYFDDDPCYPRIEPDPTDPLGERMTYARLG
ncbi:hypothetical protein BKA64DRAFT_590562 [Cadophora sp. MPI-SDFR-AT-0126]|nr:hypothetical protein BKA64DRAFT_590562 [Leotiomycetes sp. MPI-SDFR-AT-0126]